MDTAGGQAPGLTFDDRNTARQTRARYEYQDQCVALRCIRNFASNDVEAIVLEWATDYIVVSSDSIAEYVSVKHRERNQGRWTLSELLAQNVFQDLYRTWLATGRAGNFVFQTNAGVDPQLAAFVASSRRKVKPSVVDRIAERIGVSSSAIISFLDHFSLDNESCPDRMAISDLAVRELQRHLTCLGEDPRRAEAAYEAIAARIAAVSVDRPDTPAGRIDRFRGLMREGGTRIRDTALARQTITMDEVREIVRAASVQTRWASTVHFTEPQANPLFTGREGELTGIAEHLRLDELDRPIRPLVLAGLTGVGKTELALEFAYRHRRSLRVLVVPGATREAVLDGLQDFLDPQDVTDEGRAVPHVTSGRSSPSPIPDESGLLLIFDGVTDPVAVRGLMPRASRTRIIITSTMRHVDDSFHHLPVDTWTNSDTTAYLAKVGLHCEDVDSRRLSDTLGQHPLAITQAANYCLAQQLAVIDYLQRFALSPHRLLAKGEAQGHPTPALTAILMAFDAVSSASALATKLLTVLAYMAPLPLEERVFDQDAFLARLTFDEPVGTWSDRLRRPRRVWARNRRWKFVGRTVAELQNPIELDTAIGTLLRYSLVTRTQPGIACHPLVQLAVRGRVTDSELPYWLTLCLGLLMHRNPDEAASTESLTHLLVVSDYAQNAGYHSPVSYDAHLRASKHHRRQGAYDDAIRHARAAIDLAGHSRSAMAEIRALQEESSSLQMTGRADECLAAIRKRETLARLTGIEIEVYRALRDRMSTALFNEQYSDAQQAETEVMAFLNGRNLPDRDQLVLLTARTRLAWATENLDQAQALSDETLALARNVDLDPELIRGVYDQATEIAHRRGDDAQLHGHQDTMMTLLDRRREDSPIAFIDGTISHIQMMLEYGKLSGIEDKLSQIIQLAEETAGTASLQYGHAISARGRLRLLENEIPRAKVDLELAISILDAGGPSARGALACSYFHLALIEAGQGEYDEALTVARQAHRVDCSIYGDDHIEVAKDLMLIGQVQYCSGDVAAARSSLQESLAMLRRSPSDTSGLEHQIQWILRECGLHT